MIDAGKFFLQQLTDAMLGQVDLSPRHAEAADDLAHRPVLDDMTVENLKLPGRNPFLYRRQSAIEKIAARPKACRARRFQPFS